MAAKRRKRRRRRSREQMTPEEIKRAKKRAIRRKRERAKRRFYTALFFALLFFAVIFFLFLRKGKSEDSVSANSVMEDGTSSGPVYGAGGTIVDDLPDSVEDDGTDGYGVSGNETYQFQDLSGVIDTSVPMDLTSGKAAFAMDIVSGNRISEAKNVKLAMEHAAYFTGTSTPLQNYLSAYGEGEWHAINKNVNEMTVFYSGIHKVAIVQETEGKKSKKKKEEEEPTVRYKDVPFQVNFIVYEDGSFVVQSVEENGQTVDDFEGWLRKRVDGDTSQTTETVQP